MVSDRAYPTPLIRYKMSLISYKLFELFEAL